MPFDIDTVLRAPSVRPLVTSHLGTSRQNPTDALIRRQHNLEDTWGLPGLLRVHVVGAECDPSADSQAKEYAGIVDRGYGNSLLGMGQLGDKSDQVVC